MCVEVRNHGVVMGLAPRCSGMNLGVVGNPGFVSNMGESPPESRLRAVQCGDELRDLSSGGAWGLGVASSRQLPAELHHL